MITIDPKDIPQVPNSKMWKRMELEWKKYKNLVRAKNIAHEMVSNLLNGKQSAC